MRTSFHVCENCLSRIKHERDDQVVLQEMEFTAMEESKVLFIMGLINGDDQLMQSGKEMECVIWGVKLGDGFMCKKKNLRGASWKKCALQACLTFRLFSLLVDFHTFT